MSRIDEIDIELHRLIRERVSLIKAHGRDNTSEPLAMQFHRPYRMKISALDKGEVGLVLLTAGLGWTGISLDRRAANNIVQGLQAFLSSK